MLAQLLNGLAGASSLFLVSAGLSLIFGVTRIVNFAHGSLMMLGAYIGYSLIGAFGSTALGYWSAVVAAAIVVALIGVAIEFLLLRRIYAAPELVQLVATFAVVLIVKDVVLAIWGPEDLLGPRAQGFRSSVVIAGRSIPEYDLLLIGLAPIVLALLVGLARRTRWGVLVRAATQDREMTAALGVNQAFLFSTVFMLGAFLAGLGGALQLPREPANLNLDLAVIADVFVVTVIGGLGSIGGAYLAALLVGIARAFCIGLGDLPLFGMQISFPKLALVVEFAIMAVVLVVRPWGFFGRPSAGHSGREQRALQQRPSRRFVLAMIAALAALAILPFVADEYTVVLLTEIAIFALFAASLHFMMGFGGMASFGHAAYFGLGAYGAALASRALPMELALVLAPLLAGAGGLVFGWFCVRLSGVYLAMLTLAFAQITWAILYQWDTVTGGSNGLVGVWPAPWLADRRTYYLLTLFVSAGSIGLLWRTLFAPYGYRLRASRDSALRAEAIGIDVRTTRWIAFMIASLFAGVAGSLYAFSKGSIAPESASIGRSVDVLVMVLSGGLQTLTGPLVGAAGLTWLQDSVARHTEYWRALLGGLILATVLLFPQGVVGSFKQLRPLQRLPR